MFDRSDLRAAVEAGAISDEAAKRLEAFLKSRNDSERMLDAENLRFLSSFNDVFLTIGILVLMTGVSFLSAMTVGNVLGLPDVVSATTPGRPVEALRLSVIISTLPVLAVSWLLAEYFCGRRRLLLPSMALSAIISLSASVIGGAALVPVSAEALGAAGEWSLFASLSYASFGFSGLAAGCVFWRFRLPFSLFVLAGSLAGLFYTLVSQLGGASQITGGAAMLAAGLATLVAAILFDMRDPARTTRNADHAFWLHLAAAPQIIFGVRGLLMGSGFAPAGAADAAVMLAVLILFAVLSLALNRRALIVSGLVTFATALGVLLNELGGGGVNALMLTALLVGGAIVLLGGGWRTARRALLRHIPEGGALRRLFPPEPA